MPDEVGLWQIKCGETNGDWDYVAVTSQNGTLWVHDADVGAYPLELYHRNLTDPEWRKVA